MKARTAAETRACTSAIPKTQTTKRRGADAPRATAKVIPLGIDTPSTRARSVAVDTTRSYAPLPLGPSERETTMLSVRATATPTILAANA